MSESDPAAVTILEERDYRRRALVLTLPIPGAALEPSLTIQVAMCKFRYAGFQENVLTLRFAEGLSKEDFDAVCEENTEGIRAAIEAMLDEEVIVKAA